MKNISKNLIKLILIFSLIVALFPTSAVVTQAASGGFYVNGTTVYDANGNAFVMRGVNIAHAWFPGETEAAIKGAAARGANTVRIVCSNGRKYTKTSKSDLEWIINTCKANKVVAVLEVHDTTGSDSISDLDAAVDYWKEMKDVVNNNKQYVIVNIGNEWCGKWDSNLWAEGNKKAIKAIRNAGIQNLLMIDCAGWGQYPDSIKDKGREVFNSDPNKNLMFSIHMYEYAGADANTVKTNINNALAVGAPLCIGEFGFKHTDGDVDEYTIMQYSTQKGVGYMGWSWKGNGDTWKYLDLANDASGNSLTDWGNTLFYGDYGISKTSKTCTVFGGSSNNNNSGNNNNNSNSNTNYNKEGLDGVYYIKNLNSGKYLDVENNWSGDGVNVRQWEYNGCEAQQFKLVSDGQGYYTIYTGASGFKKCLDVADWNSNNGANIQQWSSHGGDCQKFQLVNLRANRYIIKTKMSNCYGALDVSGISKENGANVQQWEYLDGANQQWYLEKVTSNNNNNNNSSNNNSSSNNGNGNSYTSLFWGKQYADSWKQVVSVMTTKNGGSFNAAEVKNGGCFYVEYDSNDEIELVLQSWSGGAEWAKVSPSETGTANGHKFAKFSYDNCKKAFGSNFSGQLDQVHASAKNSGATVYSVCYIY